MQYFLVLINYFRFFAELAIGIGIFSWGLKKREHFNLRFLVSLTGVLLLIFLLAGINVLTNNNRIMRDTSYMIIGFCGVAWVPICFKEPVMNYIFHVILGNTARSLIHDLTVMILSIAGLSIYRSGILSQLISLGMFTFGYIVINFTLGKSFRKQKAYKVGINVIGIYVSVIAINIILGYATPFVSTYSQSYYILLLICQLAYSMLIFVIHYVISKQVRTEIDLRMSQQLAEMQRKQFQQQKENIENINIKFHDLKHQLREVRQKGQLNEEAEKEILQAVSLYNSKTDTGNCALDVILAEKGMQCENKRIEFTCIAEGKKFAFMKETDIYSLFGNAIENAIEYLEKVEDPDNRFMFINVKEKGGFLVATIENYYEGDLRLSNGLPITSKEDKILHGFGMKSIKQIVERYKGNLVVQAENNLFKLKMVIPIPQ